MKFYDWRKCSFLVNGVLVTGWANGDDVFKAERIVESATYEVGADGKMTVSLNADKSVKITIKLAQTSPMNAILSHLCAGQDDLSLFVPVQGTFNDNYRQDSVVTSLGFIEKHANMDRGTKAQNQEWTLIFESGWELLGNPAFSGLVTAAAESLGG